MGQGLLIIEVTITLRQTTLGRTNDQPEAKTSTLTIHNTHKRQIFMPPTGFEPATPASERPQTHALDSAVFAMPVLIKDKKQ
jgi:hypothetical protein